MDSVRSLLRQSLAPAVGAVLIVAAAGCADGEDPGRRIAESTGDHGGGAASRCDHAVGGIGTFAPVPFAGSDGRTHMVYEWPSRTSPARR